MHAWQIAVSKLGAALVQVSNQMLDSQASIALYEEAEAVSSAALDEDPGCDFCRGNRDAARKSRLIRSA
jgi:hypothetical protein